MESYIIDSFVMGYHDYKDIWSPIMNEELKTRIEPDNPVDKYAVAVIDENNEIVGHLMKGLNGKFAKLKRLIRATQTIPSRHLFN